MKFSFYASSETQGQIVWARECHNRWKNMARRKVKNGETSPGDNILRDHNSKWLPPFWLLIGARKRLCFSAQSEGSRPMSCFVCPYTE